LLVDCRVSDAETVLSGSGQACGLQRRANGTKHDQLAAEED